MGSNESYSAKIRSEWWWSKIEASSREVMWLSQFSRYTPNNMMICVFVAILTCPQPNKVGVWHRISDFIFIGLLLPAMCKTPGNPVVMKASTFNVISSCVCLNNATQASLIWGVAKVHTAKLSMILPHDTMYHTWHPLHWDMLVNCRSIIFSTLQCLLLCNAPQHQPYQSTFNVITSMHWRDFCNLLFLFAVLQLLA